MGIASSVQQYYANNYQSNSDVVFLGLDQYNGSSAQVSNIFQANTGVQFPLLTNALATSNIYGANKNFWVIDKQGIVTLKSAAHAFSEISVTTEIDNALAASTSISEISSFAGTQIAFDVKLNWTTTSETDNEGFIIERSDDGGVSFSQIASYLTETSLVGAGTTTMTQNYSFTDLAPNANATYTYRLSSEDSNGNVEVYATDETVNVTEIGVSVNFLNTTQVSNTVNFDWETGSEGDILGYVIYRSEDGTNFNLIATYVNDASLVAVANTSTAQTYNYVDPNVVPNTTYTYKFGNVNANGIEFPWEIFIQQITVVTDLEEENPSIESFFLSQNYPNPFNPSTTINYELESADFDLAKLSIFNVLGQKIKEFTLTEPKGSVVWNGADNFGQQVSSGIYFYKLETNFGFSQVRKAILMK